MSKAYSVLCLHMYGYVYNILGFPSGSDSKESACNAGDLSLISDWKIPWRREWLLTPVFLPGEFHEQRSLVGYGHRKESDTTERLSLYIVKILL